MAYKLSGKPYEYIDKIEAARAKKKKVYKSEVKEVPFWDNHGSENDFMTHPDTYKAVTYRSAHR